MCTCRVPEAFTWINEKFIPARKDMNLESVHGEPKTSAFTNKKKLHEKYALFTKKWSSDMGAKNTM